MKRLSICMVVFTLVIFGLTLLPSLSFSQQAGPSKAVRVNEKDCPPGRFDQGAGRCKDTGRAPAGDASITPMVSGECPPGRWDASAGKCKDAPKAINSNVYKNVTPATSGECPPGKWDASAGRCKG